MTSPILKITDGTTTVNLIGKGNGIMLSDWRPVVAAMKDDGVWQSSGLTDGRRMVLQRWDNVVETFVIHVANCEQDDTIEDIQNLRRLLQSAVEYWTSDYKTTPVWIEAKAPNETNTRYAIIYSYKTSEENNPFAQSFFGRKSIMRDFTLVIERGHWLSDAPGTETCVQVSATQNGSITVTSKTFVPTASGDDCMINIGSGFIRTFAINDHELILGTPDGSSHGEGLRFRNVTVPQGSTILSASIRFQASQMGYPSSWVMCFAEQTNSAAIFTTMADYNLRYMNNRYGSGTKITWDISEDWTTDQFYFGVDISAVIQEIISRAGWVSGNDLAVFLETWSDVVEGYYYWSMDEGGGKLPPTLYITYLSGAATLFGQEETCDDKVYVCNKHNTAQISYKYIWDDSVGTLYNISATVPPYYLLPNVGVIGIQNDDWIAFGVPSAIAETGPFTNLVFNLTHYNDMTVYECAWEYWNGAAWASIPDIIDNTDMFNIEGVNSVSWRAPTNWVSGIPDFGLPSELPDGWWVRFRVVATPGGLRSPRQTIRNVYTTVWPYIDIEADQVEGDIPAIAKLTVRNQGTISGDMYATFTNRLIVGSRSIDRGADFSAYLNFSDIQNPLGITAVTNSDDGAMVANPRAPSGRCIRLRPDFNTEDTAAKISISSSVAGQYYGTYRVFLRGYVTTTKTPFQYFWLEVSEGGVIIASTAHTFLPFLPLTVPLLIDLGQLSLYPRFGGDEWAGIDIRLKTISDTYSAHGAGDPDTYLIDLILMPTDEWCGDFWDASEDKLNILVNNLAYIDLDSITKPKSGIIAVTRAINDGTRTGAWQYISNNENILLQANKQQRLWFLTARTNPIEPSTYCMPDMLHSVQLYKNQRYFSARGSR